ncbi:MAG: N-acetylmuramoyl-L-alanine amidase, partial [Bacteroidota bacterium]
LDNLNRHSIGICLANRGYVRQFQNKKFASVNDKNRRVGKFLDKDEVVRLQHPNEVRARFWEKYTAEQLTTARELCKALIETYPSIVDIVGHDEIAVGRKSDPGPAFPMASLYDLVPQRGVVDRNAFFVITPNDTLNVRRGPSRFTDAHGVLQHEQIVFPRSFCYKWDKKTKKMEKTNWLSISLDERHFHNGFVHAKFLKKLKN